MKVDRKMERARATKGVTSWSRRDSGQVTIVVAIAMGTFLLGFVGFGADMTNLWFHKQAAQNAADSTCLAGAMDMLYSANAGTPNAATGGLAAGLTAFTPGTPFDCGSGNGLGAGNHLPNSVPCKYAKLNGYNGRGFPGNAQREGNAVSVSFPATIPGVTTPPAAYAGTYPFMRVDVLDRVKVYFSSMLGGSGVQDVVATAKCGIQGGLSSVPLLVLNPTVQTAFSNQGTAGGVYILGGPTRSIQVNSKNALAAGGSTNAVVDLSQGGPNYGGSSFGVTGGPAPPPFTFYTNAPAGWNTATIPIPDPFRNLAAPPVTIGPGAGTSKPVLPGVDGCPLSIPWATCTEYSAGTYPAGITVSSQVALFAPGVYHLGGAGLTLWSNSLVRPTDPGGSVCGLPLPSCHTPSAAGDGSMGTIFYLKAGATVSVGSNSGSPLATSFKPYAITDPNPPNPNAKCPGQVLPDARAQAPDAVDGNVLLAPCTNNGTYEATPTNVGPNRGMLFYQDHATAALPNFGGGGALLLNGAMYFHTTDYNTQLSLAGNSGTNTQVVGSLVVDKLALGGGGVIKMNLNPLPFAGLSVALLQ